jgi:hypothetical protein
MITAVCLTIAYLVMVWVQFWSIARAYRPTDVEGVRWCFACALFWPAFRIYAHIYLPLVDRFR